MMILITSKNIATTVINIERPAQSIDEKSAEPVEINAEIAVIIASEKFKIWIAYFKTYSSLSYYIDKMQYSFKGCL